jgi:hypothetical protein
MKLNLTTRTLKEIEKLTNKNFLMNGHNSTENVTNR